jgi:hypothetical protein
MAKAKKQKADVVGLTHEMLHGAYLALELLDTAMGSGFPDIYKPVKDRHPEIGPLIDNAEAALAALYQGLGAALVAEQDKEAGR